MKMNEVERAEILLDTYHQMASPVTEIAKMFKEHAAEAAIDMRERCRAAAHATAPDYINVCWRIMDVPINATGEDDD